MLRALPEFREAPRWYVMTALLCGVVVRRRRGRTHRHISR
jgi:hypothetical protein